MKRRIRITAIRRDPPDYQLLAKALIALAREKQQQQRQQQGEAWQKERRRE